MKTGTQSSSFFKYATALALGFSAAPSLADLIYSEDFEQESSIGQFYSTTTTTNYTNGFGNFLGRFGNKTVRLNIQSEITGGAYFPSSQNNSVTAIDAILAQGRVNMESSGPPSQSSTPPLDDYPTLDLSNSGSTIDNGLYNPGVYNLTFDLYLFDSWDGGYELYGPDRFAVAVNGVTMFDELIDTRWPSNNFRLPDEELGTAAGNSMWEDYIYRDITIEFTITEATDIFIFDFIGTPTQGLNDESWGIDNVRVSTINRSVTIPAPSGVALLGTGLAFFSKRRRAQ